ncbi:MAG TPA: AraC family transcriptional regulator [Thermoanaerobaculia bacterium]|nr:AraC family transcriptional regulator [Thermoanaerobaculia bacterium]
MSLLDRSIEEAPLSMPSHTLRGGLAPGEPGVLDVIFEGRAVRVSSWRCPVLAREWSEERVQSADAVAFPRDVPFAIHAEGESIVADRNVVLFHSAGVSYRTSHPFGTGDRGLLLRFARPAPFTLRNAERRSWALRSPRAHLLQEILFRRGEDSDRRTVESLALRLLSEARRLADTAPAPPSGRRREAAVQATRRRLASDLRAKLGLAALAAQARYSPFHLARTFRQATGVTLRRYRLRARLFAALPRVLEDRSDLMQIGLDLGFSSHSHLTSAFHAEFGMSPSSLRRLVREEELGFVASRLGFGPARFE